MKFFEFTKEVQRKKLDPEKKDELSNHLGNVLSTITDIKFGVDTNSDGIIDYYTADVAGAQDYYPFGATQPGRSNGVSYRYGFNGKEKDKEGMTQYDYGFRIYDPRLGRFKSVDPKASKFPWQSPFSAMDNNPILKNDPDGSSGIVTIDEKTKTVTVTSTLILYGNSASPALAKSTAQSVEDQWNDAHGTTRIDGVEYQVKFIVTPQYVDINEQGGLVGTAFQNTIQDNKDYSQNYLQVVTSGIPASGMDHKAEPGGNTGQFLLSEIQDYNSTTESHEMGHGWGAVKGGDMGHPKGEDNLLGQGQPGMMNPKGVMVDAPYTRNPKLGSSKEVKDKKTGLVTKVNLMDPNKRKVTQKDIDYLNLDKLDYKDGKANLGDLTNKYHK